MSALAVATALYIAIWVGVYGADIKKEVSEPTTTMEIREQAGK
jgi:hypothetical protein